MSTPARSCSKAAPRSKATSASACDWSRCSADRLPTESRKGGVIRKRYDLEGRTVLVTGAARGIGADTARRLAGRGARLALLDVEADRLDGIAAEIGGDRAIALPCDVTDWAQLEDAVAAACERFDGIDVVIANAGIATVGTVETIPRDDFERVIEVNLLGVWRTIRATLPQLIERRGYALAVSSLAAAIHTPLMASYTAAKAGVEAFGDALRAEVAHRGVDVGVAYFGFIDTEMVSASLQHPAAAEANRRSERRMPSFISRPLPVGRAGKAIVDGIERRARRVYAPRWILPAILAPSLFMAMIERGQRGVVEEPIELADRLARSEEAAPRH